MKTKLFTLFLTLAMSVGNLFAEKVQIGDLYYNLDEANKIAEVTYQDGGATTSNNYSGLATVSIPEIVTYNAVPYSVTSIGERAFKRCKSLTSISIPNSITTIGYAAFEYCTGLSSVTIGNGVTNFGQYAFSNCQNLRRVNITDIAAWCNIDFGWENSNPLSYAKHLYVDDIEVTELIIPNNVTSVGSYAFSGCSNLTSITIHNSVTRIGYNAFVNAKVNEIHYLGTIEEWCAGAWGSISSNYSLYLDDIKIEYLALPSSVAILKNYAFYGCTGLKSVTFSNSITSIGECAFYGCTNLNSVTMGNGIASIGSSAFFNCTGLTSVTIPNSVTSIENSAFFNCTGLTSVTIPNSVTSIGNTAFFGCSSLTSVTIGNGVASIGERAFSGCTGLTSIIWNVKTYPDFTNNSTPFYYDVYASYKFDLRPQITSFVIGDDVEYVPAYLCAGMENLTTLSIGKSVAEIGNNAFSGLSNRKINQLALPNSLTTIGEKAFAGDAYLESIYFGSSLESIGKNAFESCARVSTMTCLANVTPNVAENALASINSNAILYVLNSCLQKYKVDENWNRFVIEPLGTSDVLDPEDDVTVSADDNTATFTWPTNSAAESYKLVITKGGETICTLLFNGSGQLVGISFAPAHDGQSNAPAAILTAAGMQFTVTGLSYATRYTYVMTIKDGSNKVLATYSGSFGTTNAPESTEGFEPVSSSLQGGDGGRLILHNGQIYILRGDKTYTLTGQEIK